MFFRGDMGAYRGQIGHLPPPKFNKKHADFRGVPRVFGLQSHKAA